MNPEAPKCPPAIVVIEDDPNVSMMLTRHLERQGWCVRAAGSLAGAREVLRTGEWDVVLLDRNLPDGDGVSLCSELRASAPHGYITILTGEASDAAKLEGFDRGADDYITKPFQLNELLARIRAGLRIVELQKALIDSNRQLEELSVTDGLTHLRNRRAFDDEITSRFEHSRRYERPLSLAIIDVDRFKSVNDEHGHTTGDAVLSSIAEVLVRASRGTDFVARFGGEEFAVILPETQFADALRFAEKIRDAVSAANLRSVGGPEGVAISVGVSSVPHSEMSSAEELVRSADLALYRAKHNGRNRVEAERRRNLRPAGSESRPDLIHLRSDRRSLQP
ncbi:MAG: diguanylate cyclase [Thermoanaerobaculia bacterium]